MNFNQIEALNLTNFRDKLRSEFKKFDSSNNFFNCFEDIYFLKIPIERIEYDFNTLVYFKVNAEGSYIFPNSVFSQQLNEYYIHTMKLFNIDQTEFTLNDLCIELYNCLDPDICDLDNMIDLENYTIWAGRARLNSESQYLEIPILLFNSSKVENRNSLYFRLQQEWQHHWEDNTYDEIGRKAASCIHSSLNNTINDIHIISSLKYEGNECRGRMLLRQMNLLNCDIDIELKDRISINDHKRIRKLLETTNNNLILVIDTRSFTVSGYKIIESDQIQLDEEDIYISFKGFFSWECRVSNNKPIFYFEHLQLKFPIDTTNDIKFFNEKFNLTFNKAHSSDNNISEIVENAKKQKKGTMVVILDTLTAHKEADRLQHSSTLISRTYIPPKNILNFSEIDGAIIIDTDGICHSFGVILDGESTEGDPARGARFNSAQRYLKTKRDNEIPCMIVVVSEDGYIDVLSTYKKTVKDEILV
ncbi:DNA integrity scanning protein DisA nucleotide-binding domain protein [Lysinibacillus sp. NPDC097287]|uniref:DNA integrity scanning protein DisA nucleotide-binding domain protein n=1 Tax=Lysinibacillus sp. NPDC097287 TaxID=3364144 RepID=UPI0038112C02